MIAAYVKVFKTSLCISCPILSGNLVLTTACVIVSPITDFDSTYTMGRNVMMLHHFGYIGTLHYTISGLGSCTTYFYLSG